MRVAALQMVSGTQLQLQLGQASAAGAELAVPWGQVLAQHAQGPALVLADVRRERLNALPVQLPTLNHGVL